MADSEYCSQETTDEGTRGKFQWIKTAVNDTATAACNYGPSDEVATRPCLPSSTWGIPSLSVCRTIASDKLNLISMVSSYTYQLKTI